MKRFVLLTKSLLIAIAAYTQTPNTISFQGSLNNVGTTTPVANGNYDITFELFDDVNNSLWSETQSGVLVTDGLINVQLGSVNALEIDDFYQPLQLEITIDTEVLSPRIALSAVPFAQTSKAVVGTDSIVFRLANQKAGILDQTNTALGFGSFTSEQGAGFFNEAIGTGALAVNNGGSQNVAIGSYALGSNTIGDTNIAIGFEALNASTITSNNVAVGFQSLTANTDGDENVGVGANTLLANTTGFGNSALGFGALAANTIGANNVAIGVDALNQNSGGSENIALGAFALVQNNGTGNVGVGAFAAQSHAAGDFNTAIGYNAGNGAVGVTQQNGTNNTLLGADANVGVDGLTNATAIGYEAVVSQSNSMVLGNSSVNVGIGTSTPAEKLSVNGNIAASGVIRSDSYEYLNPKTHYYFMSGLDFKVVDESQNLTLAGFDRRYLLGTAAGTSSFVVAPFNLPDGAIIREIEFYVYDADPDYDITDMRVYSNDTDGGYPVGGIFNGTTAGSSTGSSGNQTITSAVLSIPVDNTNQGFWLYARMRQATSLINLGIYGARITYTTLEP